MASSKTTAPAVELLQVSDPYKSVATEPLPSDKENTTVAELLDLGDPYKSQTSKQNPPITNQPIPSPMQPSPSSDQLTQEQLQKCWLSLFDEASLATFSDSKRVTTFLKDVTPRLSDDNSIEIKLTSSFAEHEVKIILSEVMNHLRKITGTNELTPRIVVEVEQKAAKPYQSVEKYENMLKINPELAELRKILPDIDI